jgi:hypothetical protein
MDAVAPDRGDILNEPGGLYEVIDGRSVEKPVGVYECWLTTVSSPTRVPNEVEIA